MKHTATGNDFTGKRHQPRGEHWPLLTWYCDSLFYYSLTGKPEHSVSLPPANLSISARSHGSLWISCITSLAVKLRSAEATTGSEAPSWKQQWGSDRLATGRATAAMTLLSGTDTISKLHKLALFQNTQMLDSVHKLHVCLYPKIDQLTGVTKKKNYNVLFRQWEVN